VGTHRIAEPASVDVGDDVARRWVEASCATQGVAVKIADEGVVAQVVTLLTSGRQIVAVKAARSA